MGKIDIKYVDEFCRNNSSSVLVSGQTYMNAKSKLKFMCSCGEIFETNWDSFRSEVKHKRQCNRCGLIINNGKSKLLNIDLVRKEIIENGCKLVSDEYRGIRDNVDIMCSCGEIFETTMNQFRISNDKCCDNCKLQKKTKNKEEELISILNKLDYKLVQGKLNTKKNRIIVKDKYGFLYDTTLTSLMVCLPEKFSVSNIKTIYNIDKFVRENSNCVLLSEKYCSSRDKLLFKCKCGKDFETSWNEFAYANKRQCNTCGRENIKKESQIVSNENRYCEIINLVESNGYKVLNIENENNLNADIHIVDRKGYKYNLSIYNIINKKTHNKFCKSNKFYVDNLKNYVVIKNIDVKILKVSDNGIKAKCICGDEFNMKITSLLSGKYQCNKCRYVNLSTTNSYDFEYVKNFISSNTKNEYEMVSDTYTNSKTKILIKHTKCGNIFKMRFGGFVSGYRCPICANMRNESLHASILKQVFMYSDKFGNKIKRNKKVVVEDRSCVNPNTGYALPTDIVDYDRNIVVEIQSMYHEDESQKVKDAIKRLYWEDRGFEVFPIDHRDYTIPDMINLFYRNISSIPEWISYDFGEKIDANVVQELINGYYSYKEIATKMNVKPSRVQGVVSSKRARLPDDYFYKSNVYNRGNIIVKLDFNMKLIEEYDSATQASIKNNLNKSYIGSMLRHGKWNVIDCHIYARKIDYDNSNVEIKINKNGNNRRILAVKNDNIEFVAKSQKSIAKLVGVTKSVINNSINRKKLCNGFEIVYMDEYYMRLNN